MRRFITFSGVFLAFYVAGIKACEALASEEDRVWETVEAVVDGFSDGSPLQCTEPLATDFRDPKTKLDKFEIRRLLAYLVRNRKVEGVFPFRATVDRDQADIRIEGEKAGVSVSVHMEELKDGSWQEVWVLDLNIELAPVEGEWYIVSCERETTNGEQPFR